MADPSRAHTNRRRASRRGFTLVEIGVAMIVIAIVSLAGLAYYANSRIPEIQSWHRQNALYLLEREVESWQGAGYNGLSGAYNSTHVGPTNFLPYGYSVTNPDPAWDQTGRFKPVTLNDFNYRIRARLLFTHSAPAVGPNDFWVQETWNNGSGDITYRYRQVQVFVQWAGFDAGGAAGEELMLETRMAR